MLGKDLPVVGVDVGGSVKGFHCVALRGNQCEVFRSQRPAEVATWCAERGARAVGVDAPCQWAQSGGRRQAEVQLADEGMSCFATPTRSRAVDNPFYGWMLAGEALYGALVTDFPMLRCGAFTVGTPCTFETFPYAVACALNGAIVQPGRKAFRRRTLLEQSGVEVARLRNIDYVDAALCAITAQWLILGKARRYGGAQGGEIVVPDRSAHMSRSALSPPRFS